MGNLSTSKENPQFHVSISKTQPSRISIRDKLLKDNNTFMNSCTEAYFNKFHKKIVENDIKELCRNLNQKKLFINIKGKYPNDAEQQIIYKQISNDMQQKGKHLYNQLILHYSQFLNELFEFNEQLPIKSISSYNQGDVKTSTQLVRNISFKRSFSEKIRVEQPSFSDKNHKQQSILNQNIVNQFLENKKLAFLFLEQLSCIFKLCQTIIEYTYGSHISSIFGNDIDTFTDRQLLITKIYQKDIFKFIPQISLLLSNALPIVYNNRSALITNDSIVQSMNETFMNEYFQDSQEQTIDEESTSYEINQKTQSYLQTFSIIDSIINCKMPWLKFKLIGKLENIIVDMFLRSRSNKQISQFKDIIQPEDSKIEVLRWILQKYMCSSDNQNLLSCYYYLRWMQEYDSVIHQKLKTFTCPYFVRFISLYEIAYNYYQRKQAMLLFNQ